jgi:hypothetical protein
MAARIGRKSRNHHRRGSNQHRKGGSTECLWPHGAFVLFGEIQDKLGAELVLELAPKASFLHCDVTQEKDVAAATAAATSCTTTQAEPGHEASASRSWPWRSWTSSRSTTWTSERARPLRRRRLGALHRTMGFSLSMLLCSKVFWISRFTTSAQWDLGYQIQNTCILYSHMWIHFY